MFEPALALVNSGVSLRLVITAISSVAVVDDELIMDDKAYEGAALLAQLWPGPVRCIFRIKINELPFGRRRAVSALPFGVKLLSPGEPLPVSELLQASVVMASGDNPEDLDIASFCEAKGVPLVFVVENVISTRLHIAALEKRSPAKKLKALLWIIANEFKRRAAFSRASGLALNGMPAQLAYSRYHDHSMTFFDTRMQPHMIAGDLDLRRKSQALLRTGTLRLAFSGRLEALKGADDLVLVAEELARRGISFVMDIFGAGSLEQSIRRSIQEQGLSDRVKLHGPVDFRAELVPFFRENVDVFVCCHRQSDPSCTYMEAMGCGVPIVGYRNGALSGLLSLGMVGIATAPRNPVKLATQLEELANQPHLVATMARAARDLSSEHDFEKTFHRRVEHCLEVVHQALRTRGLLHT